MGTPTHSCNSNPHQINNIPYGYLGPTAEVMLLTAKGDTVEGGSFQNPQICVSCGYTFSHFDRKRKAFSFLGKMFSHLAPRVVIVPLKNQGLFLARNLHRKSCGSLRPAMNYPRGDTYGACNHIASSRTLHRNREDTKRGTRPCGEYGGRMPIACGPRHTQDSLSRKTEKHGRTVP